MIVGTLNIRRGGSSSKRKRISVLINQCKTDIFLIQETNLEVIDSCIAKSF